MIIFHLLLGRVLKRVLLAFGVAVIVAAATFFGGSPEAVGEDWSPRDIPDDSIVLQSLQGGDMAIPFKSEETVLMHFFATWCEACQEEFPALRRFALRAKNTPLKIVVVAVDDSERRLRGLGATEPLPFRVLLDPKKVAAKSWQVSALPTSILIPAHGKAAEIEGEVDWDELDPDKLSRYGKPPSPSISLENIRLLIGKSHDR